MRSLALGTALIGLQLLAPGVTRAQDGGNGALWELGAGGIGASQQAYPGAEQQLRRVLVLPFFIYRGERLRADRDSAGLRAIKTDRYELDVGFGGAFGAGSDEIDARRGMPALGTLIEFGPRLKLNLAEGPGSGRWRLELPLRGAFDVSNGATHRGMAFEPELVFERRAAAGWRYATRLSAVVGDRRLADTFYAVDPAYATADRPAYAAQGGLLAWRLALGLSYSPTPDWRLFGAARLNSVAGAANADSPLVRQREGTSLAFGVAYTLMRSERRAVD